MQEPLSDPGTARFVILRIASDVPEWRLVRMFSMLARLPGVLSAERFTDLSGLTLEQLQALLPPSPRKSRSRR